MPFNGYFNCLYCDRKIAQSNKDDNWYHVLKWGESFEPVDHKATLMLGKLIEVV